MLGNTKLKYILTNKLIHFYDLSFSLVYVLRVHVDLRIHVKLVRNNLEKLIDACLCGRFKTTIIIERD